MHFNLDPAVVRAEQFKASGKWYQTFALDMREEYSAITPIHGVRAAMERQGIKLAEGWSLVVFEPYHSAPYPVMIKNAPVAT